MRSGKLSSLHFNLATKVEWFRGRERYLRWEEEDMWIRREMATVVLDFDHRSQWWCDLSTSQHARFNLGYESYCKRQANLWAELRDDAFDRCRSYLEVSTSLVISLICLDVDFQIQEPHIALCSRVFELFKHRPVLPEKQRVVTM